MRLPIRAGWGAAAAATIACLWLHGRFFMDAGPLWRDEAACVELSARLPWSALWSGTDKDFFPALYFSLLRLWTAIAGSADQALRVPGLLIGLGSVALLWIHARAVGARWPIISLALFGLNPLAVRSLDYVRPYGLGILFLLTLSILFYRLSEKPGAGRAAAAALAAVLGLRCFYQLAFFILAFSAGAAAAAWRRRDAQGAWLAVAAGAAAALSLMPETQGILGVGKEQMISRAGGHDEAWWSGLRNSFGTPRLFLIGIWWGAALAGLAGTWRDRDARKVYFAVTLIVAVPLTFLYLWLSGMVVQAHYFVPLMALMAASLDAFWGGSRAAAAAAALLFLFPEAQARLGARQTNVDLIAGAIEREASADDLVVVNPWHYGVSFQRYYRGKAAWITVPPLPIDDDFKVQNYKPVERIMRRPDALEPVLAAMARTLKSGHRLWIVGSLDYGRAPAGRPTGLYVGTYYAYWSSEAGAFVAAHAKRLDRRTIFSEAPVNRLENPSLDLVEGWRN